MTINIAFIKSMLEKYSDPMTAAEFAEAFRVSETGALRIIERDIDGAFKIGSRWRIPKESVIDYIVRELKKSNKRTKSESSKKSNE